MNPPSTDTCLEKIAQGLAWTLPPLFLASRGLADTALSLTALFFLYRSYRDRNWVWTRSGWFLTALLFSGYVILINAPFGLTPLKSILYGLAFLRWPVFAAALGFWILATRHHREALLKSLFWVSLFIMLDTGWQYLTGTDLLGAEKFTPERLTGPFFNPVPGTLMLRILFLLLFLWASRRVMPHAGTLHRTLALLTLGLLFMFITGERMPFILYLAGVITLILGMYWEFRDLQRHILIGSGVMVTALIIVALLNPDTTQRTIFSFFKTLMQFGSSEYGQIFSAAMTTWLAHPLIGSGLHNYPLACAEVLRAPDTLCGLHPHNPYLQLGSETGLVGLLIFVTFLGLLLKTLLSPFVRRHQWYSAAIVLSLFGVSFWPIMAAPSIFNNWIAALIWLGMGSSLAFSRAVEAVEK